MSLMPSLRSHLALSVICLSCSCRPVFECDVFPERCPGLKVDVTAPSIINKSKADTIRFTVAHQPGGRAESPNVLTATLMSIGSATACQRALLDPVGIYQAPLRSLTCAGGDVLTCSGIPDQSDLSTLISKQIYLCAHGNDIGGAPLPLINKTLQARAMNSTAVTFDNPGITTLKSIVPLSLGISNKLLTLLFRGNNSTGSFFRQMNLYRYSSANSSAYINLVESGLSINDVCLTAVGKSEEIVLYKDSTSVQYNPYICAFTEQAQGSLSCTLLTTPITDNVEAVAADPVRKGLVIATSDKLRGYDYSNSTVGQTWEISRALGPVKLALGELDGTSSGAEATTETVAIWLGGWPDNGKAMVVSGGSVQMSYSSGLTASLSDAMRSMTPALTNITAFALGDLDNDGLPDIAIGSGKRVLILLNQGNGVFRLGGADPFTAEEASLRIMQTYPIVDIAIGNIDSNLQNELVVLTSASANSATFTAYSIK